MMYEKNVPAAKIKFFSFTKFSTTRRADVITTKR